MNEEISEEQLDELKGFVLEDNNLYGKPKLHVDCQVYQNEYKNKVEAGLEIAKALQLIGLAAAVVLALEAAKKVWINTANYLDSYRCKKKALLQRCLFLTPV